MRASDFRLVRRHEVYRIACDPSSPEAVALASRFADLPGQIERFLADMPDPDSGSLERSLRFVLAHEQENANSLPLRLAPFAFDVADPLHLTWEVPVGNVGDFEFRPPGATLGNHIVARARLGASILADVVWRAVATGLLSHVCVVVLYQGEPEPGTVIDRGVFESVRLVGPKDACMPGARILSFEERTADDHRRRRGDLLRRQRGGKPGPGPGHRPISR